MVPTQSASQPAEEALRGETSFTYLSRGYRRSDLERISPSVLAVLGYTADSFTGQFPIAYHELVHEDDRSQFLATIADAVRRGAPFQIRYRARCSSGRQRWLWERGRPLLDQDTARVTAIAGFVTDVTHLVSEFASRQQQAELEASLRSVVSVIGLLRANQPSSPSGSPGTPPMGGYSSRPYASAPLPTHDVLTDLMELTGEERGELGPADLNGIVRSVADSLTSTTPRASELMLALDESIPHAVVCPDRLTTALYALMRRAVRACGAGRPPTVATRRLECSCEAPWHDEPGPGVLIEITDHGSIEPPERLQHLFEPYQDDGTGETGLAMSLAWRSISSMGGRLAAERLPTGEFRISIALRARAPAEAEQRTSLIRPRETAVGPRATVLVVDDTPVVRRTTTLALRRAGFRVLVAESSGDALSLIESSADKIDVLVTDVVMPGATGQEIASAFRQRRPEAGILFVSGYSEESAFSRQDRCGRTAFLQKPFGFSDLTGAVSLLVAPREGGTG